uniref:RING-type domain-containing protein n=1 Tax=viral metagenome TaxID=1070528 RepID=A0A6C0KZC6_9ZZZZ|tara:strand:+ start:5635 stop:6204 length:570 start_codon:yes stop_codon:yes gene_type:complete
MKLADALKLFDDDDEGSSPRKECLITRQEIKNEIIMKCNHSFEHDALLKHLVGCQRRYDYHKCPYCRKVYSGFIPYYQNVNNEQYGEELLNSINKTLFKKNDYLTCSYCFSSGKNKGKCCGKIGHKFKEGNYCFTHYKQISRKKKQSIIPKPQKQSCCKILANGNQCKLKCFNTHTGLCKLHDKQVDTN